MVILEIIIIIYSIILHEIAHGWIAQFLGDYTAKRAGRLTLNPISHIDPFMTVLLPLVLLFIGSPFILGGAKPVPINPSNFKNYKRDIALTAAAGPITNILIAVILSLFIHLLALNLNLYRAFTYGITINIFLAIFNLLPLPPLDGSKVIGGFLPQHLSQQWLGLEKYSLFFLVILLISFNSLVTNIIYPVAFYIINILLSRI
jgi:Zn-dependent protease